jgi:hypothetical protein
MNASVEIARLETSGGHVFFTLDTCGDDPLTVASVEVVDDDECEAYDAIQRLQAIYEERTIDE